MGPLDRRGRCAHMARLWVLLVSAAVPATAAAQQNKPAAPALPPLPDSAGWGIHVLAAARDAGGSIWLGTYGRGLLRLRPGATAWDVIRHDSSATSLSWDYVQAVAFGPRGEVWYGTVGNGWGLSLDGGQTWRNWGGATLGREWQYVAPDGIAVRGDTTVIATADGLQLTTDDGVRWIAIVDSAGPESLGPADTAVALLASEYVRRVTADRRGWLVSTLHGNQRVRRTGAKWEVEAVAAAPFTSPDAILIGRQQFHGTQCGLRPAVDTLPCYRRASKGGETPRPPLTTWFRRPIDPADNPYIDQTYRYGSTMGGNFQQHQGVEFNNPDGTPVLAIGSGTVTYAGRAEQGALTVAIRHDSVLTVEGRKRGIWSVYYHNTKVEVKLGQRVAAGQRIARVGNTGRATNEHLHLEVHVAPLDSAVMIVDSLERFPPYSTNPELWLEPLPGTGILAGQVLDTEGHAVPGARIYGLEKPDPRDTPFSYIEAYADHAHSHPLYGEHFAVSDVPPGAYILGTDIGGVKVFRRVVVQPGLLTWVVFKP
jgi:murein DD-endopeptidase MepM/ murein hydrolase activator NlpD